jgi:hypothetical protein
MTPTTPDSRRDVAIANAVRAGKITARSAADWKRRWDRDPGGTERTLAGLAAVPGLNDDSPPDAGAAMPAIMASFGIGKAPVEAGVSYAKMRALGFGGAK